MKPGRVKAALSAERQPIQCSVWYVAEAQWDVCGREMCLSGMCMVETCVLSGKCVAEAP